MCGIVGIINQAQPASPDIYLGLMAMQHRGKEGAGIATYNANELYIERGSGELPQAFWPYQSHSHPLLDLTLPGTIGIGHVRYSTAGTEDKCNLQPIENNFQGHKFAVAHNGNLVNTRLLAEKTKSQPGSSDTKIIADLISKSKASSFEEAIIETAQQLEGSFNLIFLFNNKIIAIKDRFGFHPLQIGQCGSNYILASESCVFDLLNAKLDRDVLPGEMIIADKNGILIYQWNSYNCLKFDIFEYIYFLRPDSIVHGVEAGQSRYWMGYAAAESCDFEADIVVPVSDSGNEAALGFFESAQKRHPPLKIRPYALFRPHIVSRTFIEPVNERRVKALDLKFNSRPIQIAGKRVIAVDDSQVRGHTAKKVSRLLREAGARKVYFISASPMYCYPDFYGIDTYRAKNELIARRLNNNLELIRRENQADGLFYNQLSSVISAIMKAAGKTEILSPSTFYTGPFTGEYPAGTGDFTID